MLLDVQSKTNVSGGTTGKMTTIKTKSKKELKFNNDCFSIFMKYYYGFCILIGIFPVTFDRKSLSVKFKWISWKSLQSFITLSILAFCAWLVFVISLMSVSDPSTANKTENSTSSEMSIEKQIGSAPYLLNLFIILIPFILGNSMANFNKKIIYFRDIVPKSETPPLDELGTLILIFD